MQMTNTGLDCCKAHQLVKHWTETLEHQKKEFKEFSENNFRLEKNGKVADPKTVEKVSNGLIQHSILELNKAKKAFEEMDFKMCPFSDLCDKHD